MEKQKAKKSEKAGEREEEQKVDIFALQERVRELFPDSSSSLIDDLLGPVLVGA